MSPRIGGTTRNFQTRFYNYLKTQLYVCQTRVKHSELLCQLWPIDGHDRLMVSYATSTDFECDGWTEKLLCRIYIFKIESVHKVHMMS